MHTLVMSEQGVAFLTLADPRGPFQVAATSRGVVAAGWTDSREAFAEAIARRLGARLVPDRAADDVLRRIRPTIERILAGEPASTDIPLDLTDRSAFDRAVLEAVQAIAPGETASYGEVARRVGAPRAARAVGGAVGRNPISMIVPCHRVIAADGTIGGYGGDGPAGRAEALEWKRELLLREGLAVPSRAG